MTNLNKTIPPKLTVVIVNWNGERFLNNCLSALMKQTVSPYEIILVDNASTDASLDIVRTFPSVRLLAQSVNLGFARANNLAIELADKESEWIALLNPDAYPESRWLETLLSASYEQPSFDIFGSKLVVAANPKVLDGAGDAYHISGLVWRMANGEPDVCSSEHNQEVFSPCAAAALYRRSAILEVGGFDEDFFCYVEDVDLGFRLRLAGYRCLYVPSSVAQHVGSGTTGGQHSDFSVYHGHRNVVWTYVKDMPGLLFWTFLPLHLAMNVLTLMIFTLRGQGKLIFRAKRDAVLGLPKMWSKRRQIQKKRVASWRDILRIMKIRLR
ncbi:COG1216 Predicted glycosyltransferases [Burkholderiaceae bacterium]